MVGRVARPDSYKSAGTGVAEFSARPEFRADGGTFRFEFYYFCNESDRAGGRCGPEQLYRKFRSDCARGGLGTHLLHQGIRRRPVRMAVQQRTDNAPIKDAGEGLVVWLGGPFRHALVPFDEGADFQAQGV